MGSWDGVPAGYQSLQENEVPTELRNLPLAEAVKWQKVGEDFYRKTSLYPGDYFWVKLR